MAPEPLMDGHGRRIGDVRLSVTDRCNFRCRYCMPAEGMRWIARGEILGFEEIERLVRLFVVMGVRDVRLTGGESPVRRDFATLVRRLAAIEGTEDLSLTINGYLLAEQAQDLGEAGIGRVNVSIDTLARRRFFEVTRRDALDRVLVRLDAIAVLRKELKHRINEPGFRPPARTMSEIGG